MPSFADMTYTDILPLIERLEKLNAGLDKVDAGGSKPDMRANQIKKGPEQCQYDKNCKEKPNFNKATNKYHTTCYTHFQKFRTKKEI